VIRKQEWRIKIAGNPPASSATWHQLRFAVPDQVFFASAPAFRAWLLKHHESQCELWVGFYKKGSGKPSITWPESVDEALCFGWIDGIRKRIDDISYRIRFTPRKPRSNWSLVNCSRVEQLSREGRMLEAGLRAFEDPAEAKSGIYSYKQRSTARLGEEAERQFRADTEAWKFFQEQPPWYRKTVTWWVVSAKKEETRLKRLRILIDNSRNGRTIPALMRPARKA